jgi:hypothetical protein
MIKEIVEPMFKTMLPGPLKALHFTKLDLGPVPITFSNVTVSRTEADGIKIEMNVSWLGQCSVGLDAPLIPDLVCLRLEVTPLDDGDTDVDAGRKINSTPWAFDRPPLSHHEHHSLGKSFDTRSPARHALTIHLKDWRSTTFLCESASPKS